MRLNFRSKALFCKFVKGGAGATAAPGYVIMIKMQLSSDSTVRMFGCMCSLTDGAGTLEPLFEQHAIRDEMSLSYLKLISIGQCFRQELYYVMMIYIS